MNNLVLVFAGMLVFLVIMDRISTEIALTYNHRWCSDSSFRERIENTKIANGYEDAEGNRIVKRFLKKHGVRKGLNYFDAFVVIPLCAFLIAFVSFSEPPQSVILVYLFMLTFAIGAISHQMYISLSVKKLVSEAERKA